MGVFGITRAEMERAIERECSNRSKEMEATMNGMGERINKLETDSKRISEHEAKIDKLEEQFKALDKKIDNKFSEVSEQFRQLDSKFESVIRETRSHVDGQVDKAISQLLTADKRWENTNVKLQDGMDTLNKNMTGLVETVKGLDKRTDALEMQPYKEAYDQRKDVAKKVADILWKIAVGAIAAYLAAKGINIL